MVMVSVDVSREANERRMERAGIMEFSGNMQPERAEIEATKEFPCPCGSLVYWISIGKDIFCGACHHPRETDKVLRWFDLSEKSK